MDNRGNFSAVRNSLFREGENRQWQEIQKHHFWGGAFTLTLKSAISLLISLFVDGQGALAHRIEGKYDSIESLKKAIEQF